jgi:cycloartenol synthase
MQFARLNPLQLDIPSLQLADHDQLTEHDVLTSLRRAITRYSTFQAHDGHWPGDYGGPMFLMPGLVCASYLTFLLSHLLHPSLAQLTMINSFNRSYVCMSLAH